MIRRSFRTQSFLIGHPRSTLRKASMSTTSVRTLPRSIFNNSLYSNILSLWFKDMVPGIVPSQEIQNRWFGLGDEASKKAFDQDCRRVAGQALDVIGPKNWPLSATESASADEVSARLLMEPFEKGLDQQASAEDNSLHKSEIALAMVLLLDQFPRNIFRTLDEEKMVFSHYDRLAVALSRSIASPTANGQSTFANVDQDESVREDIGRRNWYYLPLMHSEDLADHRLLASKNKEMQEVASTSSNRDVAEYVEKQIGFEDRHLVLIERFGRYPHRNKCLGRQETSEEKSYLEDGGERFGR